MTAGAAVYRLEAVRHQYAGRAVLDIETLDVRQGETLAVIGPSGSGKSTLLRLLQFLERPTSGRLWFEGREVTAEPPLDVRRRVTTVFQRPVVLSRTVRSNLAYGLRVRGVKARPGEIDHLLDGLGLAPLAHAAAPTLSGGEMQRVSFARALAFDPEVLLLDEPTANLDPRNVRLVEGMIRERQAQGVTMVLATHQIFQARRLAHRTALLLDGQVIESAPTAQLLDRPADPRTKAFLSGDMVY
jgi:tungstate transport system ATP-binding protein